MAKEPPVIVSACLVGLKTRHDGKDALNTEVLELLKGKPFIPVCPEQLGGLPTPRPRAEIREGDGFEVMARGSSVIDEYGKDVTPHFLKGASETLKAARLSGARTALLKEKSPSCGVKIIKRRGKTVKGAGVTAALLLKEGLKVKGF